jgi:16S rRNA (uracil1498-N3)-methyltransferase
MSARFYINCPLQPGPVVLEGAEARHLGVVCRLRPGDPLCLFNGDGNEYPARVLEVQRRQVSVEIAAVASPQREIGCPLVVASPVPKGDRAPFLIEKLTEIGATSFVSLTTRHSVIEPRESRLEKFHRHVIEASKQCGRNVLMNIEPLASWEIFCRRGDLPGCKVFGHPGSQVLISDFRSLWRLRKSDPGFTLAVGPEGGFTDEEVEMARAAGWLPLDLGPRILRIETATLVLAACAIMSLQ